MGENSSSKSIVEIQKTHTIYVASEEIGKNKDGTKTEDIEDIRKMLTNDGTKINCKTDPEFANQIRRLISEFNTIPNVKPIDVTTVIETTKEQGLTVKALAMISKFLLEGRVTKEQCKAILTKAIQENAEFAEIFEEVVNEMQGKENTAIVGSEEKLYSEKNREEVQKGQIKKLEEILARQKEGEVIPEEEITQALGNIVTNYWRRRDLAFDTEVERREKRICQNARKKYELIDTREWEIKEKILQAAEEKSEIAMFMVIGDNGVKTGRIPPKRYDEYIRRFKKDDPNFAEKLEEARSNGQENKIINEH